jgi:hypothetical protein
MSYSFPFGISKKPLSYYFLIDYTCVCGVNFNQLDMFHLGGNNLELSLIEVVQCITPWFLLVFIIWRHKVLEVLN